ncbi:protein phosphatase PPM9, putative (PPM9) [Plasmodium malariae]|uniref:protein-serine/threonine phosphatase n=1 Tax=Plasmodium malariae TaxID=5858 RepID=A0A1A8W3M9_PLAMA|nr:protein phosphatase PPM9, putative (PPM9) [Plasmodium malariae]
MNSIEEKSEEHNNNAGAHGESNLKDIKEFNSISDIVSYILTIGLWEMYTYEWIFNRKTFLYYHTLLGNYYFYDKNNSLTPFNEKSFFLYVYTFDSTEFISNFLFKNEEKQKIKKIKLTTYTKTMQGRRKKQEDRYIVITDLTKYIDSNDYRTLFFYKKSPLYFFSIFDGHRGIKACEYCMTNIIKNIIYYLYSQDNTEENAFKQQDVCSTEQINPNGSTIQNEAEKVGVVKSEVVNSIVTKSDRVKCFSEMEIEKNDIKLKYEHKKIGGHTIANLNHVDNTVNLSDDIENENKNPNAVRDEGKNESNGSNGPTGTNGPKEPNEHNDFSKNKDKRSTDEEEATHTKKRKVENKDLIIEKETNFTSLKKNNNNNNNNNNNSNNKESNITEDNLSAREKGNNGKHSSGKASYNDNNYGENGNEINNNESSNRNNSGNDNSLSPCVVKQNDKVLDPSDDYNKSEYNNKNVNGNCKKKLKFLDDLTDEEIIEHIKLAFLKTDEQFLRISKFPNHGCTIISLIILKNKMFVANLGDCRAIGVVNINNTLKTEVLSHDHKPNDPKEKERIKKMGGDVICLQNVYRVKANVKKTNANKPSLLEGLSLKEEVYLAVSRAIGDKDFKYNNVISATPDVICKELYSDLPGKKGVEKKITQNAEPVEQNEIDENHFNEDNNVYYSAEEMNYHFVLMACDGVWDTMSNKV